jgi:hypothetical protein
MKKEKESAEEKQTMPRGKEGRKKKGTALLKVQTYYYYCLREGWMIPMVKEGASTT